MTSSTASSAFSSGNMADMHGSRRASAERGLHIRKSIALECLEDSASIRGTFNVARSWPSRQTRNWHLDCIGRHRTQAVRSTSSFRTTRFWNWLCQIRETHPGVSGLTRSQFRSAPRHPGIPSGSHWTRKHAAWGLDCARLLLLGIVRAPSAQVLSTTGIATL
jgi:hypothetical protein